MEVQELYKQFASEIDEVLLRWENKLPQQIVQTIREQIQRDAPALELEKIGEEESCTDELCADERDDPVGIESSDNEREYLSSQLYSQSQKSNDQEFAEDTSSEEEPSLADDMSVISGNDEKKRGYLLLVLNPIGEYGFVVFSTTESHKFTALQGSSFPSYSIESFQINEFCDKAMGKAYEKLVARNLGKSGNRYQAHIS